MTIDDLDKRLTAIEKELHRANNVRMAGWGTLLGTALAVLLERLL